jgi:hypothetical protein
MIKLKLIILLLFSLLLGYSCIKDRFDKPSGKYNPIGKYRVSAHIYSWGTWPYIDSYYVFFSSVTQGPTDSTYYIDSCTVVSPRYPDKNSYYHSDHFSYDILWNDSISSWWINPNHDFSGSLYYTGKGVRISKTP